MNIHMNIIFFIMIFIALEIILLVFIHRYPSFLLIMTFTIFTLDAIFLGNLPIVSIKNINVGVLDILSSLLILNSAIEFIVKRVKRFEMIIAFWGALLLISWIRGIGLFGLERATNFLRTYIYFYASFLAFSSIKFSRNLIATLMKWMGIVSWVLIALSIERWLLVSMGVLRNPNWLAPGGLMIRVINASQAQFLLQTMILSQTLPKQIKAHIPLSNLLSTICLVTILLLQHRTVWFALIVFFLIFTFLIPQPKINLVKLFLIMSFAFSICLLSLYAVGSPFAIVDSAARNLATFSWRLETWRTLVSFDRYSNALDFFGGQPFGTGYERRLFDNLNIEGTSPHNFFVQTFLNIGAIGVTIVLLIYGKTLLGLGLRKNDKIKLSFLLLVISQLLFSLTYFPGYEQGVLLGFAWILSRQTSKI